MPLWALSEIFNRAAITVPSIRHFSYKIAQNRLYIRTFSGMTCDCRVLLAGFNPGEGDRMFFRAIKL